MLCTSAIVFLYQLPKDWWWLSRRGVHMLNFVWINCVCLLPLLPSVLWRCWLGGRKGIRPVKTEWWGAGMVICLKLGADLHMAQLMPLPLTVSCFTIRYDMRCYFNVRSKADISQLNLPHASVKSRLVLPFWYRLTWVVPEKGPLNVCVYMCVLITIVVTFTVWVKNRVKFMLFVKISIISNALNIYASYTKNTEFHWYPNFIR